MPKQLFLVDKPVRTAKEHARMKLQDLSLRQAERERRRKSGKRRRAAARPPSDAQLGLEFPDAS